MDAGCFADFQTWFIYCISVYVCTCINKSTYFLFSKQNRQWLFFLKSKNFFKCLSLDAGSYFLVHFAGERGKKIFKWLHYTASILKSFLLTFFCYHTLKALAFCLNWNLIVFHVNKCVIISLYLWLRFCSFAANKEAKKKINFHLTLD